MALLALDWLWWRAWVLWSPRLFAWQAWHLATLTFTLRGRRGTYGTGLALVAHNFVTDSFRAQLCHTSLSHTILSHNSFTHNFVTHNSFTHNSFTHNFATYISFTHNLLHNFVTYDSFTLNTFTYTNLHTHNTATHSSFTQPVVHHLLSFLPFPSHFHICLVGLSGPLMHSFLSLSLILVYVGKVGQLNAIGNAQVQVHGVKH